MDKENQEGVRGVLPKVHKWLAQQGFPLELQIGRQLSRAGFQVTHSLYYLDRQTRKAREMDILAEIWTKNKSVPHVRLALVIECKQSLSKPWIVFSSLANRREEVFPSHYLTGILPKNAVWELELETKFEERLKTISTIGKRGHGIVCANLGSARPHRLDRAFGALRSAAAAAAAVASVQDEDAKEKEKVFGFTIYLPVVVVETVLLELSLSESDQTDLTPVHTAKVLVPSGRVDSSPVLVNVVTPSGLDQVIQETKEDLAFLADRLPTHWASFGARLPEAVRKA